MRQVWVLFVLAGAVIACGCTGAAPAAAPAITPAAVTYPDLTGRWTGPMEGYDQGTGYTRYPDSSVSMNVTEQHGRILAGTFTWTNRGNASTWGFAGTIGRDGRTLFITEEEGGYCVGTIVGDDEIELIYLQDGKPYSAAIDRFRRD